MPKWIDEMKGGETTRSRSDKQENRLAKDFNMRTTSNSGATFGENDLKGANMEFEAKTTDSNQYILKMADINKMERKCHKDKMPVFVVEFRKHDREMVIISMDDFKFLTGNQ